VYCNTVVVLENVLSSWQIRAQRKFASNGASPSCSTPEVNRRSLVYTPKCLFPERKVATEDFLTFLCLRGTTSVIMCTLFTIGIFHPATQCFGTVGTRSKLLGINNNKQVLFSSTCHRTVAQCKRMELVCQIIPSKHYVVGTVPFRVLARESAPLLNV